MWCDGITRDYVQLEKGATHFSGTIWIGYDGQTEMRFEMVAPTDFTSIDKIFWEEMLPREDVTAWLFVDVENECVTIDISNAEHINLEQVSNRE